jgi:hypothetical protein
MVKKKKKRSNNFTKKLFGSVNNFCYFVMLTEQNRDTVWLESIVSHTFIFNPSYNIH